MSPVLHPQEVLMPLGAQQKAELIQAIFACLNASKSRPLLLKSTIVIPATALEPRMTAHRRRRERALSLHQTTCRVLAITTTFKSISLAVSMAQNIMSILALPVALSLSLASQRMLKSRTR